MKKRLSIAAIAILLFAVSVLAQYRRPTSYFSADELPNAVVFLPAPPDTNSTQFAYDVSQYEWGKAQRLDSLRLKQAQNHAVNTASEMAAYFSEPFGMKISRETTPAIMRLLQRAVPTFQSSATHPKAAYMRPRPYNYYNEPSGLPSSEDREHPTGSYPSGHTVRGWGMALILAEINPAAQDAILLLGYEWGQSRVILGYHWQSDVDASRMLAAAVLARMHTSADFMADMAAAREEYARLSGSLETD